MSQEKKALFGSWLQRDFGPSWWGSCVSSRCSFWQRECILVAYSHSSKQEAQTGWARIMPGYNLQRPEPNVFCSTCYILHSCPKLRHILGSKHSKHEPVKDIPDSNNNAAPVSSILSCASSPDELRVFPGKRGFH